ncbi:DUF6265 family protein [Hyphococcus luteus]|uniref:DUF6265 domain-containing protein n=1 Tax=Hyphococcus luteus TaxID=2058213 RepID=A0A2S7K965_9PROT|nr:DUF6265 family protein [Marinicaulis flavus]PQA89045.1 hypothetical protein CW354_03600 [Marinicaulis flavus]
MRFIIMIFAAVFMVASAGAEEAKIEIKSLSEDAASPHASIDELSWLIGHWKGEGLGGKSEEFISPPVDGQMMGMFRQATADGALMFYEFYLFAEHEGSLVLQIKHFNPDFTGWEEKDDYEEFPLVALEENAVYFDGLTFALEGEDVLRSAVSLDETSRADFRYERQTP